MEGRRSRTWSLAAALLLVAGCSSTAVEPNTPSPIVIGVQANDVTLAEQGYAPLAARLADRLRREVTVSALPTADELGEACIHRKVDFVILSPVDYVALHESSKVDAIATRIGENGTPYVDDQALVEAGLDPRELEVQLTAAVRRTGEGSREPRLRDSAFAACRHVPPQLRTVLVDALFSLRGEEVLSDSPLKAIGFAAANDDDYDLLRDLLVQVVPPERDGE